MRPALCDDALRLGRILAELAPDEPEVHGLVALMEIQASRLRARVGAGRRAGAPHGPGPRTLGPPPDRPRPGRARPRRPRSAARSARTPSRPRSPPATRAPAHAEETDWPRIAALYDALAQLAPSPVIELNRAVAIGMAFGPAAGLELVDALADAPALKGYPQLPAVRGDLLEKLGRYTEAREAFELAATMTTNERERAIMVRRVETLRWIGDRR